MLYPDSNVGFHCSTELQHLTSLIKTLLITKDGFKTCNQLLQCLVRMETSDGSFNQNEFGLSLYRANQTKKGTAGNTKEKFKSKENITVSARININMS